MEKHRPEKLDDLVGNEHIKKGIKIGINSAQKRNDAFPHTLLWGPPGTGKTTLSRIIANNMGGGFQAYLSNVFRNRDDIQQLLHELNCDGYKENTEKAETIGKILPTIVFLDEIHQLKTPVQEALFQAMEDCTFTLNTKNNYNGTAQKTVCWVPKFTIIGATTKPGDLDQAFVSRFKLKFTLNLYTEAELTLLIEMFCNNHKIPISSGAVRAIARRARGVARTAINFIERTRDTAISLGKVGINVAITEKTFIEVLHLDKIGLEDMDIRVLQELYKISPKKIGVARLAGMLSVTENVIKEIVEPYLMRQGLMQAVTAGRMITEEGIEYCQKNGLVSITKTASIPRRVPSA